MCFFIELLLAEKNEFLTLADLLQLPVTEVKDRMTIIEKHLPRVFNHKASQYLRRVVRHRSDVQKAAFLPFEVDINQ